MFSISLQNADHTLKYSIAPLNPSGWEVTREQEGELTRHIYYDWHRVERALALFQREVGQLTARGWRETQA